MNGFSHFIRYSLFLIGIAMAACPPCYADIQTDSARTLPPPVASKRSSYSVQIENKNGQIVLRNSAGAELFRKKIASSQIELEVVKPAKDWKVAFVLRDGGKKLWSMQAGDASPVLLQVLPTFAGAQGAIVSVVPDDSTPTPSASLLRAMVAVDKNGNVSVVDTTAGEFRWSAEHSYIMPEIQNPRKSSSLVKKDLLYRVIEYKNGKKDKDYGFARTGRILISLQGNDIRPVFLMDSTF